jgi:CubicO group peptidase (beta-lactamase class C family)
MGTHHAPGMALCVIQHGKILVSRGYGIADLENAVPVSRDSEFAMASITKQLTAAGILNLAEKRAADARKRNPREMLRITWAPGCEGGIVSRG